MCNNLQMGDYLKEEMLPLGCSAPLIPQGCIIDANQYCSCSDWWNITILLLYTGLSLFQSFLLSEWLDEDVNDVFIYYTFHSQPV